MAYDYWSGRIYPDEFDIEKGLRDLGNVMDNFGTVMGLSANQKAKLNYWAHGIPVIGDFLKAKDQWNHDTDYLRNRGLNWSDVKYTGMNSSAYTGISRGYSFVSDNIRHLYDEDNLEETRRRRDYLAYHEAYARGMGWRDGYYA